MNVRIRIASLLLGTLLLAACGGGLSGTYSDPMGVSSYTFQPNGKLEVNAMGATVEMHYELDGNKIKVGIKDGPVQVMTLNPDGSISGPMGVKLTKKQ